MISYLKKEVQKIKNAAKSLNEIVNNIICHIKILDVKCKDNEIKLKELDKRITLQSRKLQGGLKCEK